jgi:hypothetical protein
LINNTSQAKQFKSSRYENAQLLFWSDGLNKQWDGSPNGDERSGGTLSVPPFGLVILDE